MTYYDIPRRTLRSFMEPADVVLVRDRENYYLATGPCGIEGRGPTAETATLLWKRARWEALELADSGHDCPACKRGKLLPRGCVAICVDCDELHGGVPAQGTGDPHGVPAPGSIHRSRLTRAALEKLVRGSPSLKVSFEVLKHELRYGWSDRVTVTWKRGDLHCRFNSSTVDGLSMDYAMHRLEKAIVRYGFGNPHALQWGNAIDCALGIEAIAEDIDRRPLPRHQAPRVLCISGRNWKEANKDGLSALMRIKVHFEIPEDRKLVAWVNQVTVSWDPRDPKYCRMEFGNTKWYRIVGARIVAAKAGIALGEGSAHATMWRDAIACAEEIEAIMQGGEIPEIDAGGHDRIAQEARKYWGPVLPSKEDE